METTVRFLVQITDNELTNEEKTTEVNDLYEDLQNLSGIGSARMGFLEKVINDEKVRLGVQFTVPADRVRAVMQRLCDRLTELPLDMMVLMHLMQSTLQIKTRDPEELASLITAAEYLLPPHRTFLAKAETYARTSGELTPAEEANLEWLRQQLDLTHEDAEYYIARALGPHRTLQDKRQHYEAVLMDEISREYPLSDETREALKELVENLNLPAEDAIAIYQAQISRIQSQAEATRLQQQEEAERTRLQQETQMQRQQEQEQRQNQQQHTLMYREEYRLAIQNTLYPSEFDQGRLEQARRIWGISQEQAEAIETQVAEELYGSIQSDMGADYSRLRQLLWQQEWQAADKETERVILAAISRDMQPLTPETVLKIPCLDLRTIDQLWLRYSSDRYGFSVQQRIYTQETGRQPLDFLRTLGWQGGLALGNVSLLRVAKPYSDLQFHGEAPMGHLPTWRWACQSLESGYQVSESMIETFFLHMEKCMPSVLPQVDPMLDMSMQQGG